MSPKPKEGKLSMLNKVQWSLVPEVATWGSSGYCGMSLATQSVVLRAAALALPESWLEMQDLRCHLHLLNLTLHFNQICCSSAQFHKAQVMAKWVFLLKCPICRGRGEVDFDLCAFSIFISICVGVGGEIEGQADVTAFQVIKLKGHTIRNVLHFQLGFE